MNHFCHPGFFLHLIEFILAVVVVVLYATDKGMLEIMAGAPIRLGTRVRKWSEDTFHYVFNPFRQLRIRKRSVGNDWNEDSAKENSSFVDIPDKISENITSDWEPAFRIFDEPDKGTVEMHTMEDTKATTSTDEIITIQGTILDNTTVEKNDYRRILDNATVEKDVYRRILDNATLEKNDNRRILDNATVEKNDYRTEDKNNGDDQSALDRGDRWSSSSVKIDVVHCAILGFLVPTTFILLSYFCCTPIWNLTFIIIALPLAAIYIAAGAILLNAYLDVDKHSFGLARSHFRDVLIVAILLLVIGVFYVIDFIVHLVRYIKGGKDSSDGQGSSSGGGDFGPTSSGGDDGGEESHRKRHKKRRHHHR